MTQPAGYNRDMNAHTDTIEATTRRGNVARVEFETEHYVIHADFTLWGFSQEDQRKARIYVAGEDDVDFSEAYALQKANGYQDRGTNPEEDKLFNRLNREVVRNQKAVIEGAMAEDEWVRSLLEAVKLTFSRKAGCSCGCSAGFVPSLHLRARVAYQSFDGPNEAYVRVRNLWITRKAS